MDNNIYQKATILSVLAHPDDESFGMGGTLALYAQRGAAVYLICATGGEVGEVDPEFLEGFSSIAERRKFELRCAAQNLGLKDVFFLNYRDSGMPGSPDNTHPDALAAAPIEEVATRIAYYMRKLKPQVVLTFDPIGGYRHPDHIAIHKATVRAFDLAGDAGCQIDDLPPYQPQKLYYHLFPRTTLKIMVRLMPLFGKDPSKYGKNKDIDLLSISKVNFPINAVIDYSSVDDLRLKAAACHASQGGGRVQKGFLGWLRRQGGNKDYFMRAFPPPNSKRKEKDLLSGINFDA